MVLIIDPQIAGISGDMLLSALVNLGANKEKILSGVLKSEKYFKDSKILTIKFEDKPKNGIMATHLILNLEENIHERKGIELLEGIKKICEENTLSSQAKEFAIKTIQNLIYAESKIHNQPFSSVHFHEAASLDTVIDILGVAIALDDLNLFQEKIMALPICVGSGSVTFSHGTISNPAAAILEILKETDLYVIGNDANSELATPTGVSILVSLGALPIRSYPLIKIESIGYGAGQKEFNKFSNVLKIVKGTEPNTKSSLTMLQTNVDDVSGEVLGNLVEKLTALGANDVSIIQAIGKKNRPMNIISIMCDSSKSDLFSNILIKETGTLGVRICPIERLVVNREHAEFNFQIQGKNFLIRYKIASHNNHQWVKLEFDDLKKVSEDLGIPIKEIDSIIKSRLREKNEKI